MENIDNEISEIIQKYLIPDKDAADVRGEVFTPPNLVREMLFGINKNKINANTILPSIHSTEYLNYIWGLNKEGEFVIENEKNKLGGISEDIWKSEKSTFLDPAAGIGNFPIIAYYKLMYTLKDKITDIEKRKEHIINNMLFMIELDTKNINTCKSIFKMLCKNATPNILKANTLLLDHGDIKSNFKIDKFTVIFGNPPYQSGGVKTKGVDGDYETIWPHFLIQTTKKFPGAINMLEDNNSFICFIHPSSWFHKDSKQKIVWDTIMKNKIDLIRIFSNSQSNKLFSSRGAVRLAYYCIENTEAKKGKTFKIIDTNQIVDELPYTVNSIYQSYNSILYKVFSKIKTIGETKYLQSAGKLMPNKNLSIGKYKYICSHKELGIETCTSEVKFKYQDDPKIIFKGSSKLYHFDDYKGEYGIFGNWGYYIVDDKISNLKRFSKFLDTKLAKVIIEATKEDQDFIEPKYIPNILDLPSTINLNDKSLCTYFAIPLTLLDSAPSYKNIQSIFKKHKNCNDCTKSQRGITKKKKTTKTSKTGKTRRRGN
jgi:hypothetical protein